MGWWILLTVRFQADNAEVQLHGSMSLATPLPMSTLNLQMTAKTLGTDRFAADDADFLVASGTGCLWRAPRVDQWLAGCTGSPLMCSRAAKRAERDFFPSPFLPE